MDAHAVWYLNVPRLRHEKEKQNAEPYEDQTKKK